MKYVIRSAAEDVPQFVYWTGTEWSGIKIMAKLYVNEDAANIGIQYLKSCISDELSRAAVAMPYDQPTSNERKESSE